jgi:hypothetical protein
MKLMIIMGYFISFHLYANSIENDFEFKLDNKYQNLIHPRSETYKSLPEKNDVEKMMALQTPVKSQGSRGTCSIFSTIAHLESLHMILYRPEKMPDYSEQWLQYINIANKSTADEGSNDPRNIILLMKHGIINEEDWVYDPIDWTTLPKKFPQYRHCQKINPEKTPLKRCLLAQGDPKLIFVDSALLEKDHPKFSQIADTAKEHKQDFLLKHFAKGLKTLTSVGQIKYALSKGIPLTLGLDFYYGSWNHKKSEELRIGRDRHDFESGFVSYPEVGSRDRELSKKEPAGHAVLIVGYDDNIIIKSKIKMADGSYRKFEYQGAYIFKNSWGTKGFGSKFSYNGKNYPGYGYISYKYAHQFGGFYLLPYSN